MVRDHSVTLCDCITISPEPVGKAALIGLGECGFGGGEGTSSSSEGQTSPLLTPILRQERTRPL